MPPATNTRTASQYPIYLNVNVFLHRPPTGIARFVARLVEALANHREVRLVSELPPRSKRPLSKVSIIAGRELRVTRESLPTGSDMDLGDWLWRLVHQQPTHPYDPNFAAQCPGIYTALRPSERFYEKEFCIFYDFTPLIVPWTHEAKTVASFASFFTETAKLCDKVIAISKATKADAAWMSTVPQDDVIVCYPGPSLCVHSHAHTGMVERRSKQIVVVGTREPRKNSDFLLKWFMNSPVIEPGTQLLWVGPTGWLWDASVQRPTTSQGGNREFKFLGQVSDAELCKLYQQSSLSIYPSLYEGFGFPVLDSLMHGTPVLSSLNSSLQEFVGPGVFYFDPYDPVSLDTAYLESVAQQPLIAERNDLRESCSWDAMARTILSFCR